MKDDILMKCPKSVVSEVKFLLREIQSLQGKIRYLSNFVPQEKLEKLKSKPQRDWEIYESLKGDYKL